jgi:phosphodiester glycosidase
VLRKLFIAVALAAIAAIPAQAQVAAPIQVGGQSLLMPGVTFERQVEFTPHGPVVLDVVTAPRPDGSLYTLAPALSNNAIVGTDTLTSMERAASQTSTVVAVNGDFFAPNPGKPTGLLIQGGVLESAPANNRSSLGIGSDGTLTIKQVAFDGTWRGNGQRRQLDLNAAPVNGHTTLYTSAWGPATPAESGVVVDVISSLPALVPNRVASGVVSQVGTGGPTPIPAGGAVLVSRGGQAPHLTAEAPAGTTIEIRPTLTPNWSSMASAIGGGPLIVSGGKPIFRANEAFGDPVLNQRSARSAIGQLSDGRILLATVEGGGSAYSAGMTNYELAVAVARLGAQTAMALGNGPSAAMAFDGTLLTRPQGSAEQPLSDALFLSYTGVYAAPPSSTTLSPNGDGIDDVETFTYKLVRPATVTASVVGPDKTNHVLAQDAEQPGVHTVQWDGSGAVEGNWHFSVTAVDDLGRTTTADRSFALNQTLAGLQVARRAGGVDATFQLAHPATVTVTVEKPNGIVVGTMLSKKLDAGTQTATWTGNVPVGYRIRVVASNAIGKATLQTPVTARS